MKILIVTPYYTPDLGPSAPLFASLSEDLVKLGHSVTVLAAVPHFPSGRVAPEYRHGLWQWQKQAGLDICRVWVPSGERSKLFHRLGTFIIFQCLASLKGMTLKYDVILITNPALETGIAFFFLAWLRRKPSIFCVWDVYPDVGVDLGIFRHRLIVQIVKGLEDFCLNNANAVQVLDDAFIPKLIKRLTSKSIIDVIPPWVDTDFIQPGTRDNPFAQENDFVGKFVVLYAGNLGLSQGLEQVNLAAQQLDGEIQIQFVYVGEGTNRETLIEQSQKLGLRNVHFLPYQPRRRLPEVLSTANLAIVSQINGLGDLSIPSKAFSILASGRPILAVAGTGSALEKLITRAQAGRCVPPGDPAILAQAVLELSRDPITTDQMGENGRIYATLHHSRMAAAHRFDELIKNVAIRKRGSNIKRQGH